MAAEAVVVIGDMHAGSTVALCTPEHDIVDGGIYKANALQLWMHQAWVEATQYWLPSILQGRPYILVVNGDCVEGIHHGTKQIISAHAGDHVTLALKLLEPLAENAAARFMVRGTSAHVGHSSESELGMMLGAERCPETKMYARHNWRFEVRGKIVDMAHHMPTSARPWTEATGLATSMQSAILESVRAGEQIADVYLRAHRHRFGYYSDGERLIVAGNPWQAKTDFAEKVVPHARVVVGMHVLMFDSPDDNGMPTVRAWSRRPKPVAPVTFKEAI